MNNIISHTHAAGHDYQQDGKKKMSFAELKFDRFWMNDTDKQVIEVYSNYNIE